MTVDVIAYIFDGLKAHLEKEGIALSQSPLPHPTRKKAKKGSVSNRKHIALYRIDSTMSLETQKAIVGFYSKKDKTSIIDSYVISGKNIAEVEKAVKACKKQGAFLIVAQTKSLSTDLEQLYQIKRKLGDKLICCDLPRTDRLTLSIYHGIHRRQTELTSITTSASMQRAKER